MPIGLNLITRGAVDAALGEFHKLGRDGFLVKYGFREAREYVVQDPLSGDWADSKAVVGAAHGYRFPDRGPLAARDFSGGQAVVVRLLRELGFKVASVADITSQEEGTERAWSRAEVELVVADYLDMLLLELAGQRYNKAARRRALIPLLTKRSDASIEFKRRNISAVMLELGYPPIRGYLPASNRQEMLLEVVENQVAARQSLDDLARSFIDTPAVAVEPVDFNVVRVIPPLRRERALQEPMPPKFRAVKRDYLEREARNSSLGSAGELFIVQYEQWRLAGIGMGQLADRVRHVAVEDGDGAGYDVLSFRDDGTERFLEVKTTAFGERTPFFVTANEVKFARVETDRFALCRLFDFRSTPRFFELPGPIERQCSLDPTTYRASLL